MASSIGKSLCTVCREKDAFFTCRNCRLDYCEDHINAHDQSPVNQMDDLLHDQQRLQQMIADYIKEPSRHPLIQQIDQWERQSIRKIQQTAQDCRTQIFNVINDHMMRIKKTLENLTEILDQVRNDEELVESLLQQGKETLDRLKHDLITPETIKLRKDDDDMEFISKLVVAIVQPDDVFDRSAGNIRIEDHGQTIIHGHWSDHSSVRGKREYSSGQYRVRFKIEELDPDKWAFFGIVSKSAPIRAISISTPTAYGFAGQDGICRNGVYQNTNTDGYKSDMEMNDKVELLIDCDHQLICLTNERTCSTHELHIDRDKCPLPWQLCLGFCCSAGDRIRILPSTYKE